MERGIYFDGWFPNEYCYHPSMPPRRLTMADDLEEMGGTMLVWAGLGGGSISLPYLEEEAHGAIPARYRQHGFVNDAEFIAYAKKKGIDLFAIVFEAQAWEFPAQLEGGEVLAQNQVPGIANATVGLREFSTDTGPASWPPFRHYFPEGLVNSDGEQVTDLWEEVACRDLAGNPLHAHWVEVDGKGQACYLADRNNPVWREYLKAVIRIQIDAGAPGIQLDETDTPLMALRYGGCFCKDCMKGFRAHLQAITTRPEVLADIDLTTFDYREWLLGQGFRPGIAPQALPLYAEYSRFLQLSITETFHEIAAYAREYAQSQGRDIRLAGNFYDCAPFYDGMVADVDVLVTEMRETRYQQPWYYRHGLGMAQGKPLVAVESPYGGITEELLNRVRAGKARDLFRLTIFEASAMGASMSLPYGSWLGTEVKDSYWVPKELAVDTGRFLVSIDDVTSTASDHSTAVVYSVASSMRAMIDSDMFTDNGRWFEPVVAADLRPSSYWDVIEHLSRSARVFDTVVFPDEGLRPHDVSAEDLSRYSTVVLADAWNVSATQHDVLMGYLEAGGRVVLHGAYGTELADGASDRLRAHPRTVIATAVTEIAALTPDDVVGPLVELMAASIHRLEDGGTALHIVNYDFDDEADAIRSRLGLRVGIRTERAIQRAEVRRPGLAPEPLEITVADGAVTVELDRVDLYAVVHFA